MEDMRYHVKDCPDRTIEPGGRKISTYNKVSFPPGTQVHDSGSVVRTVRVVNGLKVFYDGRAFYDNIGLVRGILLDTQTIKMMVAETCLDFSWSRTHKSFMLYKAGAQLRAVKYVHEVQSMTLAMDNSIVTI